MLESPLPPKTAIFRLNLTFPGHLSASLINIILPEMSLWRLELPENNLHQELLHLFFVDRFLQQDIRHGADHVQSPVLLARVRSWCLQEKEKLCKIQSSETRNLEKN